MVGGGTGGIEVETQDGYEAARSSPVDDYDEVCVCLSLSMSVSESKSVLVYVGV